MKEASVAPPPGSRPIRKPSTEPRAIGMAERFQSSLVGIRLPTGTACIERVRNFSTFSKTSPRPKMPIATTTTPKPSVSSGMPRVKRGWPVMTSCPTMLSSRPAAIMISDLTTLPLARTKMTMKPSSSSDRFSAGPKRMANSTSGMLIRPMASAPTVPATKEPIAAMAMALPARPCCAIL